MALSRKARITWTVLLVLGACLITWDSILAGNSTEGDTISEVFMNVSWMFPGVSMGLGILCGHLTWPTRYKRSKATYIGGFVTALGLTAAFIAFPEMVIVVLERCPLPVPTTAFILGYPLGRLLWPQRVNDGPQSEQAE